MARCSLTLNGFVQFGATNSWNLILMIMKLARNNGAGNDLFIQNDGGDVYCASKFGGVGLALCQWDLGTGYLFSVDGKIIAEEMHSKFS
jgi:hypothetical protein